MKRFKLPNKADCHIGAWLMPHDIIDDIGDYWNKFEFDKKGKVHSSAKDSVEIGIHPLDFDKPWDTYRKYLQDCLEDYLSQYPDAKEVLPFSIRENYNIQWYPKGGGYKVWHHENSGILWTAHRHLVFMTYCNDLPNAGTHFKYQNITTPSIKGLTLIWPAVFTHTHKGQITEEHEKMIVTGWFSFNDVFDKLESNDIRLNLDNENISSVIDAVEYILKTKGRYGANLRQTSNDVFDKLGEE